MFWYADFVSRYTSDDPSSCYYVADSRLASTLHSERVRYGAIAITNEGEGSIFFLLVPRERFGSVWAYSKNLRTSRLKFGIGHAEPARFEVSARRKSFRKEINDEVTALPKI